MAKAKIRATFLTVAIVFTCLGGAKEVKADTSSRFISHDFYLDDAGRSHGVAKIYNKEDLVDTIDTDYIPVGFYSDDNGVYEDEGEVLRIAHYSNFADYDSEANCFTATESLQNELLSLYKSISGYLYTDGHEVRYSVTPVYNDDDDLLCKGIYVNVESVNDDSVYINEFIPNTEEGYEIDYSNGNIYVEVEEKEEVTQDEHDVMAALAVIPGDSVSDYFQEYGYFKGWYHFWDDFWTDIFS